MPDTLKIVQKGEKRERYVDVFLHTSMRHQNPDTRVFIPVTAGNFSGTGWTSTTGNNEFIGYVPLYSGYLESVGIRSEQLNLGNVTVGFHKAPTSQEVPLYEPNASITSPGGLYMDDFLYKFKFGKLPSAKWNGGDILAFSLHSDYASVSTSDTNVTIHLKLDTNYKHYATYT